MIARSVGMITTIAGVEPMSDPIVEVEARKNGVR
jgi:hypothetical protein